MLGPGASAPSHRPALPPPPGPRDALAWVVSCSGTRGACFVGADGEDRLLPVDGVGQCMCNAVPLGVFVHHTAPGLGGRGSTLGSLSDWHGRHHLLPSQFSSRLFHTKHILFL